MLFKVLKNIQVEVYTKNVKNLNRKKVRILNRSQSLK